MTDQNEIDKRLVTIGAVKEILLSLGHGIDFFIAHGIVAAIDALPAEAESSGDAVSREKVLDIVIKYMDTFDTTLKEIQKQITLLPPLSPIHPAAPEPDYRARWEALKVRLRRGEANTDGAMNPCEKSLYGVILGIVAEIEKPSGEEEKP